MNLHGFQTPLVTVFTKDRRVRLIKPLVYISRNHEVYTVPEKFECDLASVPKIIPGFLRVWFGNQVETASSAVLHDYLYSTHLVSRRKADNLLYEALQSEDHTRFGSYIMWFGVRIGGFFAWRR